MILKNRRRWKNTINKYQTDPLKYAEPERLEDLKIIVKTALHEKIHIRAVGSGHSFSNIALTNGYLINLRRLNRVLDLPEKHLKSNAYLKATKGTDSSCLVHVEAGMTIQRFNKKMDKKGLSVSNMGGIDNQTLAGAISTGTHGTGRQLQAFHGMVCSILMVAGDGHTYRIEPDDGITDPDKYDEAVEGAVLRQDNDLFNSALVSLGAMGVVYSYILKLEPMFWLKETKKLRDWDQVKEELRNGSSDLFAENTNLMVQVSPYKNSDGRRNCVVVQHKKFKDARNRSLLDRLRNPFSRLGALPVTYWITRNMVRYFPRSVPGTIDTSLNFVEDKSYENKSYKVMHQGVEYLKNQAYDCEFALPFHNNAYLDALEEVIQRADHLAEHHVIYQNVPFGIRFVKGSEAYMSPDNHQTVCYIDTPFLLGTIGADEALDQYQEIMLQYGMPHWGKLHQRVFRYPEKIRRWYPYVDRWMANRDQLDPEGIFINDFTYRLKECLGDKADT